MSQKKKMDKIARAGYQIGFSDACEFWELAVNTTKGIGKKRQALILENVQNLIRNSNQKEEQL